MIFDPTLTQNTHIVVELRTSARFTYYLPGSELPIAHRPQARAYGGQGRTRDIAATYRRHEDTAVIRSSGADLHRMLHRLLRAIHAKQGTLHISLKRRNLACII